MLSAALIPLYCATLALAAPAPAASRLDLAGPAEPGVRLTVTGVLRDGRGRFVSGAELHVYQTDAGGRYTPEKPMDEPHARLSGRLRTGPEGQFEIRTIRPGGYPKALRLGDRDRHIPAHIHLDVTAAGHPERRLQLVFADDPLLADPYWKDWVQRLGQPVLTVRPGEGGVVGKLLLTLAP